MTLSTGTETLPLHRVTMLVPAQRFHTTFSLTEDAPLSVVDEFALRLLAVCGSVDTGDFIKFFGFESREGTEVLRSLVAHDWAVSPDGTVALSESGKKLFPQGSTESPRLLKIEQRSDSLSFDLLDFRLVDRVKGDPSLRVCHSFDLPDDFDASKSPDEVQQAFQAQFGGYAKSRNLDRKTRLYFVSSVTPRSRFQLPVDLDVSLRFGASVSVDLELELERDDDSRLRRMVADWYEAQCLQRFDDAPAWRYLSERIPWAGDQPPSLAALPDLLAAERPEDVLALVGSMSVPSVVESICKFIERQEIEQARQPAKVGWLPALSEFWCRSRSSWSAVDALLDSSGADHDPTALLLLRKPWPKPDLFGLAKRFSSIITTDADVPSNVEVVVAPGAWCAMWAWMKLGGRGLPVPVGFVTTQLEVVDRVASELTIGT